MPTETPERASRRSRLRALIDMLNSIIADVKMLGLADLEMLLGAAVVGIGDEIDKLTPAERIPSNPSLASATPHDPKVVLLAEHPRGRSGNPPKGEAVAASILVLENDRATSILLLEDDKAMARITRRWLERAGHRVRVFARPEAALHEIESGGAFEFYLLDVRPSAGEAEGPTLAREIMSRQPGARIIFFTGDPHLVGEADRQLGPVFAKPLNYRDLVDYITRVLGKG